MTFTILSPLTKQLQTRTDVLAGRLTFDRAGRLPPMTRYYDALNYPTPGHCDNCGRLVDKIIFNRCRLCHEYRAKHGGNERPARIWRPVAPAWEEFDPGMVGPNDSIRCDCGKLATWRLTLPGGQRGKIKLLLCDEHAALEKRLAPVHSWAGG